MKVPGLGVALWAVLSSPLGCSQTPSAASPTQSTPAADDAPASAEPSGSQAVDAQPPRASRTPAEEWASFVAAWNTGDAAQLARYEAAQDLLVLDNQGAFVRAQSFISLATFFAQAGEHDAARVPRLRLSSVLTSNAPPVSNCESEVTLSGTFLTGPARAQLTRRVQAVKEYQLAPAEVVERLLPLTQVIEGAAVFAVYDLGQSVGFLFAQNAEGITLVAIDAVVPCSA